MDLAVKVKFGALDVFRIGVGEDLVKQLDAIQNAGQRERSSIAIGFLRAQVVGQAARIMHEFFPG